MQNIPRDLTASDIKPMFIPPPGHIYLELDYGQAELRVAAELAKDVAMIEIFKRGFNIHVATACRVNGGIELYDKVKDILKDENHPEWEFWERQKKNAKAVNFGILFGQTKKKLSVAMGCSEDEAQAFIDMWYAQYPQLTKWIKNQQKFVLANGYVKSIFGRKRRLPGIYSSQFGIKSEAERQAVNTPIQGAASDFAVVSSVIIRKLRMLGQIPEDCIKVNTVHDSIGFYIKPENLGKTLPILTKVAEDPDTYKYFGFKLEHVKMKVAVEVGVNSWGDKHDYDPWVNYTKLEAERDIHKSNIATI
jgi:DNA polymerase-1